MRRHTTDFLSAIAGLIFLSLGAVMVTGRVEADDFSAMWALPVALVAVGLVFGAAAANRYKASRPPERGSEGSESTPE